MIRVTARGTRVAELGDSDEELVDAARAFSNAFPSASWSRLDPPRSFICGAFVAFRTDESMPVGAGGVIGTYEDQATIALAVIADARRQGIGRALFDAVESTVPSGVQRLSVLR